MSSLYALFQFAKLSLPRQELLSLLVDLLLHFQLDLPQLLFLPFQLLPSDHDGLVGKVIGIHDSIFATENWGVSALDNTFWQHLPFKPATSNIAQFLCPIVLVQVIMCDVL